MNKDEALKMAIEALEFIKDGGFYTGHDDCINACKEALEQPTQEPLYIYDLEAIAWALDKLSKFGVTNNSSDNALMADRLQMMLYQAPLEHPAQEPYGWYDNHDIHSERQSDESIALYTHPHQVVPTSTWQGLSDAENEAIIQSIWEWGNDFPYDEYRICIEQALKEKNHGA
jgi:hypothetical protein